MINYLVYISNDKFTCGVVLDENFNISNTAPILRKFRGQNYSNLVNWLDKYFGSDYEILVSKMDE